MDIAMGEASPGRGERKIVYPQFGGAQELQGLGDGTEIVDLHLQALGEMGEVGLALLGLGVKRLEQAREHVAGNGFERHAEARTRERPFPGWLANLAFRHDPRASVDYLSADLSRAAFATRHLY